jgi:hypothetical protein
VVYPTLRILDLKDKSLYKYEEFEFTVDSVDTIYERVLRNLHLVRCPLRKYNDLTYYDLATEIQCYFNIMVDQDVIKELLKEGSHHKVKDYIREQMWN